MDAPAKLTLSLRITGVRDDGYHLIDAEMVTLDFGDRIEIDPDGRRRGRVVVVEHGERRLADSDDLVVKALEAVGAEPSVVVHKSIPRGAGLGGGSADAAAVLRWAGVDRSPGGGITRSGRAVLCDRRKGAGEQVSGRWLNP